MSNKAPMAHRERVQITVRRTAPNALTVNFPEDVSKDFDLVARKDEIPLEFLNAALSRAIVARTQLAADCNNHCNKDCFW